MTCSGCWRAVAVGLVVLMVQGCATMRHDRGSGVSLPGGASYPDEATFSEEQVGAILEFA